MENGRSQTQSRETDLNEIRHLIIGEYANPEEMLRDIGILKLSRIYEPYANVGVDEINRIPIDALPTNPLKKFHKVVNHDILLGLAKQEKRLSCSGSSLGNALEDELKLRRGSKGLLISQSQTQADSIDKLIAEHSVPQEAGSLFGRLTRKKVVPPSTFGNAEDYKKLLVHPWLQYTNMLMKISYWQFADTGDRLNPDEVESKQQAVARCIEQGIDVCSLGNIFYSAVLENPHYFTESGIDASARQPYLRKSTPDLMRDMIRSLIDFDGESWIRAAEVEPYANGKLAESVQRRMAKEPAGMSSGLTPTSKDDKPFSFEEKKQDFMAIRNRAINRLGYDPSASPVIVDPAAKSLKQKAAELLHGFAR